MKTAIAAPEEGRPCPDFPMEDAMYLRRYLHRKLTLAERKNDHRKARQYEGQLEKINNAIIEHATPDNTLLRRYV